MSSNPPTIETFTATITNLTVSIPAINIPIQSVGIPAQSIVTPASGSGEASFQLDLNALAVALVPYLKAAGLT